jgi:hypothetical protein
MDLKPHQLWELPPGTRRALRKLGSNNSFPPLRAVGHLARLFQNFQTSEPRSPERSYGGCAPVSRKGDTWHGA